jgi:hypothetical protein
MGVKVRGNDVWSTGSEALRADNGVTDTVFEHNEVHEAGTYGIRLTNIAVGTRLLGNLVRECGGNTDDTYDAIFVENADDVNVMLNRVIPRETGNQTRYGINVGASSDCARVVGNDLGDPAGYGTDALNDAGTDTQLSWPDDATFGDNFTVCNPTS